MYYVYVLKSRKNSSLYIGYTNDLKRRFDQHNKKQNTSTKIKTPFELVYYESYKSSRDAKQREFQLKRFSQAYSALKLRLKESLI